MYTREFFATRAPGSAASAEVIVPLVLSAVPARSVCDFGCGIGTWLRAFNRHGVEDLIGLDGDYVERDALRIDRTLFRVADLSRPIDLGRAFDLAVSLEVAEHLPEASARDFVASLVRAAPVALFSAAVPGQRGVGHVNEQWHDYWAALFAEHDYAPFDIVRPAVWEDSRVDWWYRQNTLVYCRRDALEAYPALCAAGRAKMLSVMHPAGATMLSNMLDSRVQPYLSELISAVPPAFTRALTNRVHKLLRPPIRQELRRNPH